MQENQEIIPNHVEVVWYEEKGIWVIRTTLKHIDKALSLLANER